MSKLPIVKYGFTAGVLSERLLFREDLASYDLGLKTGRNWFVDYLGGASTRAGTEFVDYIQDDDEPARFVAFEFNSNIANTYGMLFSKTKIRFIQDGAYVLESTVAISSTSSTTVTTTGAHGFSVGDWIKLEGRTLAVATVPLTTTFTVNTPFGVAFDPSTDSPTECFRIYTVTHAYGTADLFDLVFSQTHDTVYITNNDYVPQTLVRSTATSWTLSDTDFDGGSDFADITSVTVNGGTGANSGYTYAVGVVDNNGIESPLDIASIWVELTSGNITLSAGSVVVSWDVITNASYYRIYRSLINNNDAHTQIGLQYGFIGISKGGSFIDENIIPDFTDGPIVAVNPFVGGSIITIMGNPGGSGSGYDPNTTTIVIGGGGTGAVAKPIIRNGAVYGAIILNPGKDYTSPTFTVTGGGGTGGSLTGTAADLTGNYPRCSTPVEQRQVWAGTDNFPNTIFGTRFGQPTSFHTTEFALDSDPYVLSLNAKQSTPIRYLEENSEGMFVFAEGHISQVRGTNDEAITTANAKGTPQPSEGCANLPPLVIGREFLHVNNARSSVNTLRPSNLPSYFLINSVSEFSNHLFSADNGLLSWCWASSPHKLVWGARNDGTFLSCAFDASQQPPVRAWTNHTTQGFVEDMESINENEVDRVYCIVKRTINGSVKRFIERMAIREVSTPDEMFSVDSGLTTTLTNPAAAITPAAYTGTGITVDADASVFVVGDVGSVLRVGNGRATVASYVSGTEITVTFDRDIEQIIDELTTPPEYASGTWSLNAKVSTVSGLEHLEGEEVQLLGDGVPLTAATVASGSVSLSTNSSYVVAGLNFTAHLKTPPPNMQEAVLAQREKRPVAIHARVYKSKEILVGQDATFYDLQYQGLTAYATPTTFLDGIIERSLTARMDYDGAVEFKKTGPIQATILGHITDYEVSDD